MTDTMYTIIEYWCKDPVSAGADPCLCGRVNERGYMVNGATYCDECKPWAAEEKRKKEGVETLPQEGERITEMSTSLCVTCGKPFTPDVILMSDLPSTYRDCPACRGAAKFGPPEQYQDVITARDHANQIAAAQAEARRVALTGLRQLLRIKQQEPVSIGWRDLKSNAAYWDGMQFAVDTIDSLLAEDAPKADTAGKADRSDNFADNSGRKSEATPK